MTSRLTPARTSLAAILGVAGLAHSAPAQWTPPYWQVERLGLFEGPEFTQNSGHQYTTFARRNAAGHAAGYSTRYNGGATALGVAAWAYVPGAGTTRIGLFDDPEFTSYSGGQTSLALSLSAGGLIGGSSEMFAGGNLTTGYAAWARSPAGGTTRLGFYTGPEYSAGIGRQLSFTTAANSSGRIIGASTRYSGFDNNGSATWTWDAAAGTVRTGLVGPNYTSATGYQLSRSDAVTDPLNGGGRIIGVSLRYSEGVDAGRATWTWDAGSGTVRTGLTDADGPEFMSSLGQQVSDNHRLSASGRISGLSTTYHGGGNGVASWTWDAANGTVRTGLVDGPEFTGPDDLRISRASRLTDSGHIMGVSRRFNGELDRGEASWVWTAQTGTVRTGLFVGPEFTRADGHQHTAPGRLNEAGRAVGTSERYDGALPRGTAAWTWDAAGGNVRIGLFDGPEFTKTDGTQSAQNHRLNAAGRITGMSTRYNNTVNAGAATWTWDSSAGTVRIGFFGGPEFTRTDGFQRSLNFALTDSGRAVGHSERFNGSAAAGDATWTWTAETGTVRTGLYDAMHTDAAGRIFNSNAMVSESGAIVGTTYRARADSALPLGQSAWYFDPATLVTTELVFSTNSIGRAWTTPQILTESGWVLGLYDLYVDDSLASTNGFVWSLASGFADLGDLIEGGLSTNGISVLSGIIGVEESSQIFARGLALELPTGSKGLFLLTVPSPGAAMLGMLGLLAARRRRHAPVSARSANVASQCSPA